MQLLPLSVVYNRSIFKPDFAQLYTCATLYNFGYNHIKHVNRIGLNEREICKIYLAILEREKFVRLRTFLHNLLHSHIKTKNKYTVLASVLVSPTDELDYSRVETVEHDDCTIKTIHDVNGRIVKVIRVPKENA